MKKYLGQLLLVSSLLAGTYDDVYTVADQTNMAQDMDQFMYGDFSEIIRFEMLSFQNGYLDDDSDEILHRIVKKIKSYRDNNQEIKIKIIGHAREATDDQGEVSIDSNTYANHMQNWWRDSVSTQETRNDSKDYANTIFTYLKDNEVNENIIFVEHRGAEDVLFTTASEEGIRLSNRVMVTIYVPALGDKDGDNDGVLDSIDECPTTPAGEEVNEKGCPLDSDEDGVYDSVDECPQTPLGEEVNEKGCPLDSDKDGVYDAVDECPQTPIGISVNDVGCPIAITLRLNFKSDSSEIQSFERHKIDEFSSFMKSNPTYNAVIIGHTDSTSSDSYNMTLSRNRAEAVKQTLIYDGISARRLEAQGRGEGSPIASNTTAEGRAENRRIEVELIR
ncbi:OmpA family protein [Sulfurimonas sp. SAG-AH-194-I05]|nr:OmpA family protein [Sulfurimonas sp. SAG-AH-194-I05]MDF1875010.1 OmpA family protein [Sulfurimonas sp. SAG-AH-194-I05]